MTSSDFPRYWKRTDLVVVKGCRHEANPEDGRPDRSNRMSPLAEGARRKNEKAPRRGPSRSLPWASVIHFGASLPYSHAGVPYRTSQLIWPALVIWPSHTWTGVNSPLWIP